MMFNSRFASDFNSNVIAMDGGNRRKKGLSAVCIEYMSIGCHFANKTQDFAKLTRKHNFPPLTS